MFSFIKVGRRPQTQALVIAEPDVQRVEIEELTPDDKPGNFKNLRSLMDVVAQVPPEAYDQDMPCSDPSPGKPMCAAGHAYRLGLISSVRDWDAIGAYFDIPPRVAEALFGNQKSINQIIGREPDRKVKPHHWVKAAKRTISEQKLVRERFS